MNIYIKIKALAKNRGLSVNEVSNLAGLGKNTIYSWKSKVPSINNISKVANVLNVNVDDLKDDHAKKVNSVINKVHKSKFKKLEPHNYQIRIPILGKITCGDSILADQNIIGYKNLTFDHKPSGTLFLLECKGHYMEPLIPNGSLVTIRRQLIVGNGELAAALVGDEATIKRVKFSNDEIILLPENNTFDPIILNERNPGSIIGKVVHVDYDVK